MRRPVSPSRLVKPLLGVVLALVASEGVARFFGTTRYVYDSARGYVMGPGAVRSSTEAMGTSTWQEGGVRRTKAWTKEKPHVLVLGDSFTEALMIDDADVFTELVEARLRGGGIDVEVLNLGRSTDSIADYIALAKVYTERFAPHWVVVEARTDDFTRDAWNKSKPHFERDGEGVKVVDVVTAEKAGMGGKIWRLRQTSKAAGWAFTRFAEYQAAAANEPPIFRAGSAPPKAKLVEDDYPVERELDALVEAFHGRVTLLFVPSFDPAKPAEADPVEARIFQRCQTTGASCVSVRDRYPELAARGVAPFGFPTSNYNSGHANALGHELWTDALVPVIAHTFLPPKEGAR